MILFSEYFNLKLKETEDWFDTLVAYDTKLFIDPFLVDKLGTTIPEFQSAHDKIINFFNSAFLDAARITKRDLKTCQPLLRSLTFPEVNELYLGYSANRSAGAGSGKIFAKVLLSSMFSLIDNGIKSIERFEELELFEKGFGADRLGDMMANLLKPELVAYTQRICGNHKVELTPTRLRNFEHVRGRVWTDGAVNLPLVHRPSSGRKFVILVPKKFLRDLPTIDIKDFWDFCYSNENDAIRSQFGQDIKEHVDRETMFEAAKKAELRRKYLESLEGKDAVPYNVDEDPELKKKWFPLGKIVAEKFPVYLKNASNYEEFLDTVREIIGNFKHFIEDGRGWLIIRDGNPGKGRREEVVQRLFDGTTIHYCRANNIDLSPEVNTGRGPVDFKFSSGYNSRALLEVKLARNTQWLDGLKSQLPTYLKSHKIKHGFFAIVLYEEEDRGKVNILREEIPKIEKGFSLRIELVIIDAQPQKSASKIKN